MFASGFFLFVVFSLLAMVLGKDAPDWLKLWGGGMLLLGIVLMLASLFVVLWKALP